MKLKFLLVFVYLLVGSTAFAELSEFSLRRVEIGIEQCDAVNNELIYKEYWKDSVKPENLKAVCIAEQFADQVASSGEAWLKGQAKRLIDLCESQSDSQESNFSCLKMTLDKTAMQISSSCVELGLQGIWDEGKCRRLVSYIFMKKFEAIFEKKEKPVEKVEPLIVEIVESELSLTSMWRIERATERCEQSDNDLLYKEYWGDSVKPENRKTICIAEQFADQVAAEGDSWLAKSAVDLIEQCEKQGRKNRQIYDFCLTKNLEQKTNILSTSCKELGEKKLWSELKCRHLVSYIFMINFEKKINSAKHPLERLKLSLDRKSENIWFQFFLNPIMAILVFLLFVLDVVFLMEKGTWMRITKIGFFIGPLILISSLLNAGLRALSSSFVIVIIFSCIAWNHRSTLKKPEKKKPIPIEF